MNYWDRMFKPVVVLCLICVIITGALAATNSVTRPIIDEATRVAQENARKELLPDADTFTRVEGIEVNNVDDVYVADNGVGTVITSKAKGYGGDVVVMTAITPDGTIKQIKVTEQAETKGIGSKVAGDASYWTRYEGVPAEPIELGVQVDALSGATISSRALKNAVNSAIEAYGAIS